MKKLVIALGGNALIKKGQKGTVHEQFANTREALKDIVKVIKKGHKVVITHGNGPQVGAIVIRSEMTSGKVYYVPLGVAVAESQGEIGYMIEQSLQNKLLIEGVKRKVACILTQVVCDKNDSSIKRPSKPIGPFYTKKEIQRLEKDGAVYARMASGRGYRRVVPSPKPLGIVEKDVIKQLFDKGLIVIACGGGGIPVYLKENGSFEGIDGVVDKDLSSAVLANSIKAETFIILMAEEKVALNFNQPNEKRLGKITVKQAKKYLRQGHFPEGSMEPKIEAAINFLAGGGKKVLITSIDKLDEALQGKTGTHIVAWNVTII